MMKILVVDDTMSMRHIIKHMLEELGYEKCDEATDGAMAYKMLQAKSYDLLITDFYMPKINGIQLLERIRADETLSMLPVLMVTCEDSREQIKLIIQAKVTAYLKKPFNLLSLKKQLERIKLLIETTETSSKAT